VGSSRAGDNGSVQLALLSLLLLVLAILVRRAISRERKQYSRFKRLRTSKARIAVYRTWLGDSFLVFGGLSALVLLATSQYVPQALTDARAWAPVEWTLERMSNTVGQGIVITVAVLVVTALVLPVILLRNHQEAIPTVGDIGAILPRTRSELPWAAALGINAGVVEELLFRFALPALIFALVGSGPLAFGAACMVFGLLHLYQGSLGVLSSTILGLIFCAIYVLSGSIVLAIVLHALFDLRSLALIPVLVMKVHTKVA
jgi:membrane protease YdiL (CAAX protease family)